MLTVGGFKWFKVCREVSLVEAKDRTKTDGQAQAGMFVRKYVHSLDSKKRLTIPK